MALMLRLRLFGMSIGKLVIDRAGMAFGKGSEMDLMVKPLGGAKGQRALEAGVAGLTGN